MTRVLVVAPAGARRSALAEAITGGGLSLVALAARLEDLPADALGQADVVVFGDDALFGAEALAEARGGRADLGIVVIAESPEVVAALDSRADGWAVIPPDLPPRVFAAVVRTVAEGLVTLPAGWMRGPRGFATQAGVPMAAAPPTALDEPLTAREREVLALLADGLSNRAIAERLGISEHTVKFHVSSLYGKLGAANRAEAVARGWQRGLVIL